MKKTLNSRLLAAFSGLALLGSIGLFASRPARSVGGPVAVSIANPSIVVSTNTPLTVTPTDSPGQQPFSVQTIYDIPNGSGVALVNVDQSEIKVPAGKRLIIQSISAYREAQDGVLTQNLEVMLFTGISCPLPTITPNGTEYDGTTLSTTIPVTTGGPLYFYVHRSGTVGAEFIYLSISGYLVDA